jgi:hypothetical protein
VHAPPLPFSWPASHSSPASLSCIPSPHSPSFIPLLPLLPSLAVPGSDVPLVSGALVSSWPPLLAAPVVASLPGPMPVATPPVDPTLVGPSLVGPSLVGVTLVVSPALCCVPPPVSVPSSI